ncbi:hypothetical protein EAF00_000900 [Botryotinia globosa]|nr:hypothetical protein EAF00_000900 [Botryotinia globosa]
MAIDMKLDTNPNTMPSLPDYAPPTKGPLSLLAATWVPYAQLMRIEKPAGYFAFYFPHIAGLLLAQSHAANLWLGASFAFGVGVGAGAAGVDLLEMCGRLDALASNETRILCILFCMYFFVVLNTLIYDTIYGHQDLKDDLKAGVKSLAVAWINNTKRNRAVLAVIEIALLVATSILGKLTTGFDILAIGGTTLVLVTMLYSVKLEDPESCMSCFKWLIWGTVATLSLGLLSS